MSEQPLPDGLSNPGRVVRSGSHLLRPATPHTEGVHAFLRSLRQAGFDGAPLPIGVDDDGRERLEFVQGDVPHTPYPQWVQSDTALVSLVALVRRMHQAAAGFEPGGYKWSDELADPVGGSIVVHNDVDPSNVVFRNGRAVALIDFEFASPGRPLYDLAHLVRLWAPIEDDLDRQRIGWQDLDGPVRTRRIADTYGLAADDRRALLDVVDEALDRIEHHARDLAASGDPDTLAAIERVGGLEKYDRRRRWWAQHRPGFAAALA